MTRSRLYQAISENGVSRQLDSEQTNLRTVILGRLDHLWRVHTGDNLQKLLPVQAHSWRQTNHAFVEMSAARLSIRLLTAADRDSPWLA